MLSLCIRPERSVHQSCTSFFGRSYKFEGESPSLPVSPIWYFQRTELNRTSHDARRLRYINSRIIMRLRQLPGGGEKVTDSLLRKNSVDFLPIGCYWCRTDYSLPDLTVLEDEYGGNALHPIRFSQVWVRIHIDLSELYPSRVLYR